MLSKSPSSSLFTSDLFVYLQPLHLVPKSRTVSIVGAASSWSQSSSELWPPLTSMTIYDHLWTTFEYNLNTHHLCCTRTWYMAPTSRPCKLLLDHPDGQKKICQRYACSPWLPPASLWTLCPYKTDTDLHYKDARRGRAKRLLEKVFSDIAGPQNVQTLDRRLYTLNFIDDFSQKRYGSTSWNEKMKCSNTSKSGKHWLNEKQTKKSRFFVPTMEESILLTNLSLT